MSSLSSLWLLKLRIVSIRNHSYQKQWRNFRNQDFQTNLAHLIILDRKMIPTGPRTKRETRSVHHFINNVPQLPSLSSNAGGRWQKIVTCSNNLSQQPTTPIHSQQNLSTVHIHHLIPHWGQVLIKLRWTRAEKHLKRATFWANQRKDPNSLEFSRFMKWFSVGVRFRFSLKLFALNISSSRLKVEITKFLGKPPPTHPHEWYASMTYLLSIRAMKSPAVPAEKWARCRPYPLILMYSRCFPHFGCDRWNLVLDFGCFKQLTALTAWWINR